MKPFNLKEHLEHPDWKVVTREGKPVRILCTDLDDNDYPVAAATKNWHVDKYTTGGLFNASKETKYDLFFATEKHEGWVNIYRDLGLGGMRCSCVFDSEEEAIRNRDTAAIATAKIEWEE